MRLASEKFVLYNGQINYFFLNSGFFSATLRVFTSECFLACCVRMPYEAAWDSREKSGKGHRKWSLENFEATEFDICGFIVFVNRSRLHRKQQKRSWMLMKTDRILHTFHARDISTNMTFALKQTMKQPTRPSILFVSQKTSFVKMQMVS